MPLEQAKKQVGSFWSYLYPKKEDIQNQLIDVMPEINANDISATTEEIKAMASSVSKNKTTWQEWFDILPEGKKHLAHLGQQMEGQIITTEGVIKANQQARAAALAHNEAIKAQTFSAKTGKVALQALAMAGSMIAMWAISKGLELAVKGIDELAHSAEHCKERVDELMSNYKSALDKANSNAKTIEDLAGKYEELSKGVNNLGENVSLTADEYSEYNDIVNQIADMFPTLIQGYTNEGNAILSLKGNVEQLRDAYKEAQKEAYNMLIISGEDSDGNDIIKNWENLHGTDFFSKLFDLGADDVGGNISTQEAIKQLEALSNMSAEAYRNIEKITSSGTREQIASLTDIEKEIGYGSFLYKALGIDGDVTDEAFAEARKQAQALIQTYQAEIDSGLNNVQTLANAYLMTNDDYDKLDEQSKTAASLLVNSIDEEIANGFSSKADVGAYVVSIVNSIKDNQEVQDALVSLLSLDTSEMSIEETQNEINKYIAIIADYLDENPVDLKLRLGVDIQQDKKELRDKLSNGGQDLVVDDWIDTLTVDEAKLANSTAFDEALEHQKQNLDNAALSAENYSAALEEVKAQQNEIGTDEITVSTFEDAWADSFTSENDAVKELGNTLLDLAEKGRLTKETFNEADSTASDYFKNLGISADEAVSKINKLVDESNQLSAMSNQISAMSDTLTTKLEEGFVSADTLSGFDVEVRGLESWDRFQEVLGSTTSSYKECQEAANALATEWVNSSDFLAQLTEQNEEYYKTQLEAMGIENYEEVISYAQALNEAKEVLAQSSLMLGEATYDEIEALIAEGQYSELTANMILALYDAKIAEQAVTIDTAADCANLIALAGDADMTSQSIQLLIQLMNIYNSLKSGAYDNNAIARGGALAAATAIKAQLESLANGEVKSMEINPDIKLGSKGKSSADKAGKDAGKTLKDALKEELSDLDSVISGITGRIDDQISSINSQKSAALDAIDAEKEALEEAKDAAVEALEAERDARLAVIEAQKEQLEEQIKLIDKQIKQKQDEIDAINDATDARKRELDLQKAQYELEKLQNTRSILQYSEDKGMHYTQDTSKIADAKEAVDDAKRQIEIANIQKEIDLLEDQKELLNEQIDLLDERADAINKYYDEQIKQTEKFYDAQIKALEKQRKSTESYFESLITNLENSKSKYQELTEILEKAELSAKLKQLGIDEEALLNGSEEEFQKLKDAYMNIVFQLNEGNDEVLSSLRELSGYDGTAPAMLSDSNTELDTMNSNLATSNTNVGSVNSSLGETAAKTSDVATNVGELESSLSTVNGLVTEEQTAFNNLREKIDEVITAINEKITATQLGQATTAIATTTEIACYMLLKEKILEVKESLDSISDTIITLDTTPVNNLTTAFQSLYDQLLLVASTLGAGGVAMEGQGEGAVGGIASAIQALNEISLEEGIIAQFTNLKSAIDEVTSAISGGGNSEGASGGQGAGGGSGKGGESGGKGSAGEGSGGNSLTGAIESMGETAAEVIGEPDAEGDGTVIGEFGAMETAVNDVTAAIGGGDSEGGEGQGKDSGGEGDGGEGTLIGSIENLGETTLETLGEQDGDGVIGKFNEFKGVIEEAANHVKSISDGLAAIDGQEVECTITVNVKMNGSLPAFASGTVLGNMQIESATYNAKYGKAFASGTIGLKHDEKNALRSEYGQPELTVYPNGTTELTTSPVMSDLPKGTVIYNEEQTKKIMDNKSNPLGNAHADGTDDSIWTTLADGVKVRPLQPGDDGYWMVEAGEKFIQKWKESGEDFISNAVFEGQRQLEQWTQEITNNSAINSVVNNNRNVQQPVVHQQFNITMPNVTDSTTATSLMNDLQSIATKKYQVNW